MNRGAETAETYLMLPRGEVRRSQNLFARDRTRRRRRTQRGGLPKDAKSPKVSKMSQITEKKSRSWRRSRRSQADLPPGTLEKPKKIETEADLSPLACWHAPPCSFLHWHGSIESRSTMEDIEQHAFAERSGAPSSRGSAAAWRRAAVHGNKTGSCWNRMFWRRYRW